MPRTDPTARRAYQSAWSRRKYQLRPEYRTAIRDRQLRRLYGISLEECNALHYEQGGKCALCGAQPKKLHVDHDHETGEVRGLLCSRCNVRMSALDDPEWLARAQQYKGGHTERNH